jgi:hypothetical protein
MFNKVCIVGEKNLNVIKMHGTTKNIKKTGVSVIKISRLMLARTDTVHCRT